MWTRFRWWLTRLICPKQIRVRFRVGAKTPRVSFAVVRITYANSLPGWMFELDCYRPKRDTVQNQAIDILRQREEDKIKEALGHNDGEPTLGEFPRKVDDDILREALEGTPLEGMDEKP